MTEQNRTEQNRTEDPCNVQVNELDRVEVHTEMTPAMMFAVLACSCILVHAAPESDRITKLPGLAGDVAPAQ